MPFTPLNGPPSTRTATVRPLAGGISDGAQPKSQALITLIASAGRTHLPCLPRRQLVFGPNSTPAERADQTGY